MTSLHSACLLAWTDHLPEILNQWISLAHAQYERTLRTSSMQGHEGPRHSEQSNCLMDNGDNKDRVATKAGRGGLGTWLIYSLASEP